MLHQFFCTGPSCYLSRSFTTFIRQQHYLEHSQNPMFSSCQGTVDNTSSLSILLKSKHEFLNKLPTINSLPGAQN